MLTQIELGLARTILTELFRDLDENSFARTTMPLRHYYFAEGIRMANLGETITHRQLHDFLYGLREGTIPSDEAEEENYDERLEPNQGTWRDYVLFFIINGYFTRAYQTVTTDNPENLEQNLRVFARSALSQHPESREQDLRTILQNTNSAIQRLGRSEQSFQNFAGNINRLAEEDRIESLETLRTEITDLVRQAREQNLNSLVQHLEFLLGNPFMDPQQANAENMELLAQNLGNTAVFIRHRILNIANRRENLQAMQEDLEYYANNLLANTRTLSPERQESLRQSLVAFGRRALSLNLEYIIADLEELAEAASMQQLPLAFLTNLEDLIQFATQYNLLGFIVTLQELVGWLREQHSGNESIALELENVATSIEGLIVGTVEGRPDSLESLQGLLEQSAGIVEVIRTIEVLERHITQIDHHLWLLSLVDTMQNQALRAENIENMRLYLQIFLQGTSTQNIQNLEMDLEALAQEAAMADLTHVAESLETLAAAVREQSLNDLVEYSQDLLRYEEENFGDLPADLLHTSPVDRIDALGVFAANLIQMIGGIEILIQQARIIPQEELVEDLEDLAEDATDRGIVYLAENLERLAGATTMQTQEDETQSNTGTEEGILPDNEDQSFAGECHRHESAD